MGNKAKKILSLVAAATMATAVLSMTACNGGYYKNDLLDDFVSSPKTLATSNGGFAVEKDGYIYFINGEEDYTAKNKFGKVVKGSLMRISAADLEAENYENTVTVVPSLFAAQDMNAGIFIYGDYVYYATPTKDKNMKGDVENSWIDFKRSRLDGKTSKDYYFRLESNSTVYRFVEEDGVVYCLYQEGNNLISYNTKTEKHTTLVEGGTYYFDTTDATSPIVYYTMPVVYRADSAQSTTASYNQLYAVNAAATAKENSKEASYTVYEGETAIKTYDFDEDYLEASGVDLKDYTEYPYVNLGRLLLDGIGDDASEYTQFNNAAEVNDPRPTYYYTYTISHSANDGVYFKRKASGGYDTTDKLYYVAYEQATDTAWKTIAGNDSVAKVSRETANANATALYEIDGNGVHSYLYVSGSKIIRATVNADGVADLVTVVSNASSPKLWKTDGDYLYYYATGTNGYSINRIYYKGSADDYNPLIKAYETVTLDYVDVNNAWYAPEMFGNTLLYSNAQSYGNGATAYNYIYAAKVGTDAEIETRNKKYNAVVGTDEDDKGYIAEYDENADLGKAMRYFFRTGAKGESSLFEAVRNEYTKYQKEQYDVFVALFEEGAEGQLSLESEFIRQVGAMKASDAEAIAESWKNYLRQPDPVEEKEEKGLSTAVIIIIVAAVVLVVAAGVLVPVIILYKKKVARRKEAEATVNAYKRKRVDTTDDKTIDVYADDEPAEEATEEAVEEVVEETVEEAVEAVEETVEETAEVAEETTEAPVEEKTEE